MKWCVIVYFDGQYEHSLGVYNFQELPRINEEIWIGSNTYAVIRVVHEFRKRSGSEDVEKENKVIVYVK